MVSELIWKKKNVFPMRCDHQKLRYEDWNNCGAKMNASNVAKCKYMQKECKKSRRQSRYTNRQFGAMRMRAMSVAEEAEEE